MSVELFVLLGAGLALLASVVYARLSHAAHRPPAGDRSSTAGGRRVRWAGRPGLVRSRRSPARAFFGLALGLLAIGGGLLLLGVRELPAPEQRGIGVVVRPVHSAPGRGLALSAAVRVGSCGDPVSVSVIASGTAEFWEDNAKAMRREGTIRVAIPDLDVSDVSISLGEDGKTAPIFPLGTSPDPGAPRIVPLPTRRLRSVTVVGAVIPRWGVNLRPVIVSFRANWLERRSYLGSCYLRLPALSGFSTVLSAREVLGEAATDVDALKDRSIFVVSSGETGLKAYYKAEYETTRGVTSLQLGSKVLRSDLSQPAADSTVQGAPTWTCSSNPPKFVTTLESLRKGEAPDIVEGADAQAGGALSVNRLGEAVGQRTCASFAVIDEPGSAVARDITALIIGALFSIGVGLVTEGLRRRPVTVEASS